MTVSPQDLAKPSPSPSTQEGTITWTLPHSTTTCTTWYIIYGDIDASEKTPLVTVHGGPGMPHSHMLAFADLTTRFKIPVVFYDQIGCGRSTRFPTRKNDATFWTMELFSAELETLITYLGLDERSGGYDLLGHSWGGMLAGWFAAERQPVGLRRLVLGSPPADMAIWYSVQRKLRDELPEEKRTVLELGEREREFESKEYEAAMNSFYGRHLCRLENWPKEVAKAAGEMMEDPTVMQSMNGPCEFLPLGIMADWKPSANASRIGVPTLLLNGRYDQAQDEVVEPWFREVPKIKWMQFAEASHLWFYQERDRAMDVVGSFLAAT